MKTTRIDVKMGIYDTAYVIRDYGTHIVTTEPFVRWHNNTGSLDYQKIRCDDPEDMTAVRIFAERGSLTEEANNGGGILTLDDVLSGNRRQGVSILT